MMFIATTLLLCSHLLLIVCLPAYCLPLSWSRSPGRCWSLVQLSGLISWSLRTHLLPGRPTSLCLRDVCIPGKSTGERPLLNKCEIIVCSPLMIKRAQHFYFSLCAKKKSRVDFVCKSGATDTSDPSCFQLMSEQVNDREELNEDI